MEIKTRSMKMVTLFLLVALVLVAVWALTPAAHAEGGHVAAVGGQEYATLQAAINAAADGDTITLLADISGEAEATAGKDQYLIADKSLTIDGNGFTVTSDSKRVFRIENGTGAMLDITFQNIRIVATNDVLDNSRCINTYSDNIALTITDSELISESTSANSQPLSFGGSATGNTVVASLRNVKIQAGAKENGYAIIAFVPVELSIENAEIAGYTALYLKDGADGSCVRIANSDITTFNQVTGESNGFAALVVESDNVNIVVEDTAFALSSKDAENAMQLLVSLQEYYYDTSVFAENCTVTMRGITVTGAVEGMLINNVDASNTVSIESGSFDVVDAKNYMADGTIFVETANGVVVGFEGDPIIENAKTEAVATVGGNYYATLQAAINAAVDGDTITLLTDISGEAEATAGKDQYLIADKSLTIDGNGFTVTSDSKRVFRIENSTGAMLDITFQNIRIVATNDVLDNSRCINTYSDNIALTITDSELISESTSANSQPLSFGGSATGNTVIASLRNVKIQAGAKENGYAIIAFVPVELSIENAEIAGYTALYLKDGTDGSCVGIANSNITTFNQTTGATNGFAALVVESDNVNIVVEDTAFALSSKDAESAMQFLVSLQEYYYDTSIFAENCTVTMRGITVTGAVEGMLINNVDASNTVSIESGSFDVAVPEEMLPEDTFTYVDEMGNAQITTDLGMVESMAGVQIGEKTFYASVTAALESAKDGDVLVLKQSTAILETVVLAAGEITLDLNGCDLVLSAQAASTFALRRSAPTYAVVVSQDTTLTLTGEGSIYVEGNGYLVDGGELIVEGDVQIMSSNGTLFTVNSGSLLINGGYIVVSDGELIVAEDGTDVSVLGGYFAEEVDAAFIPAGYVQFLDPQYGLFSVVSEADYADMIRMYISYAKEELTRQYESLLATNIYDNNATVELNALLADSLAALDNATDLNQIQDIMMLADLFAREILTLEEKVVVEREVLLEILSYLSSAGLTTAEIPTSISSAWNDAMNAACTRAELLEIALDAMLDIDQVVLSYAIEDATAEAEAYAKSLGFDGTEQTIADAISAIAGATNKRQVASALVAAKNAADAELTAYKKNAVVIVEGGDKANAIYVTAAMLNAINNAKTVAEVDALVTVCNNEIQAIKAQKNTIQTQNDRLQALAQNVINAAADASTAALYAQQAGLDASAAKAAAEAAKTAADEALAAANAALAASKATGVTADELKVLAQNAEAKAAAAEAAAQAAKTAAEATKNAVDSLVNKATQLESALGTLTTQVADTASKAEAAAAKADGAKAEATAALAAANAAKTAVEEAKAAALAAKAAAENAGTTTESLKALVENAEAKAVAAENAAKAAKDAVEAANAANAEDAAKAEKETITFLTVVAGFEVLVIVVCVVGMMLMLSRKKNGGDPAPAASAPVAPVAETPAPVAPVEEAPASVIVEKVEIEELPEVAEDDDASDDDDDASDEDDDDTDAPADPFGTLKDKKSKSFAERLAEADAQMVASYEAVRDALLSYKRVSLRISQKCASFRVGRALVAKVLLRGKSVNCYLALDPEAYPVTVYHQKDMHEKRAYAEVPFLVRVRSDRSVKNVARLVEELAAKNELVKK